MDKTDCQYKKSYFGQTSKKVKTRIKKGTIRNIVKSEITINHRHIGVQKSVFLNHS